MNVEGFRAYADLDVWVYSDPTYLGKVVASVDGRALFEGVVPDLPPGAVWVLLAGALPAGLFRPTRTRKRREQN